MMTIEKTKRKTRDSGNCSYLTVDVDEYLVIGTDEYLVI
jgi:hypothetical protein